MTVAVVGAGIAGAACARSLTTAGHHVQLFDRGMAAGGRMASRRVHGRPVDLGASYFTAREPDFVALVEDWAGRGLARPWTDTFHTAGPGGLRERKAGPMRYGAAHGLRSLVEDLLAGQPVRQGAHVGSVGATGDGPTVDGVPYDAVVLAMPDPQAARLLDHSLSAARAAVADRGWQPVLALAVGWDERSWDADFDGAFVDDSEVLAWVADDGRRRGDGAAVLVAHSTSTFAAAHLDAPAGAAGELTDATRQVLGIDAAPAWSQVQRWGYARPSGPREELFHLDDDLVGLCGDGWGSAKVETAWLSGSRLGSALAERLTRDA